MTETLLALVADYGALCIFAICLVSCAGVPIPASLALIAAGALVAAGEIDPAVAAAAGLAGAVAGDQAGYWIGAWCGPGLRTWAERRGRTRALGAARRLADRYGESSVFLSRWLVSAVAPVINLAAGALGQRWRRFTAFAGLGRGIWVAGYLGLGFVFSGSIRAVAAVAADFGAVVAGLAVMVLGGLAFQHLRRGASDAPPEG
jgi:membrane-associated protein